MPSSRRQLAALRLPCPEFQARGRACARPPSLAGRCSNEGRWRVRWSAAPALLLSMAGMRAWPVHDTVCTTVASRPRPPCPPAVQERGPGRSGSAASAARRQRSSHSLLDARSQRSKREPRAPRPTYFMLSHVLSYTPNFLSSTLMRRQRGVDPAPFATVVTDLTTCHNTWFYRGVDRCFVPTETCRRRALRMGLRADQARAAPPVLLSWGLSRCLAAYLCLHAGTRRAAACRRPPRKAETFYMVGRARPACRPDRPQRRPSRPLALVPGATGGAPRRAQVTMHGLPIRPAFSEKRAPQPVLRKRLGMAQHLPAVLLVGARPAPRGRSGGRAAQAPGRACRPLVCGGARGKWREGGRALHGATLLMQTWLVDLQTDLPALWVCAAPQQAHSTARCATLLSTACCGSSSWRAHRSDGRQGGARAGRGLGGLT